MVTMSANLEFIREISRKETFMDKEPLHILTAEFIKESGRMDFSQVMEYSHGLMATDTKGSTLMELRKEEALSSSLMEKYSGGNGQKESSTVLES